MARSKQRCVVMAVNSIRQGFQLGRFWVGSFWLLAFILAFVVRSSYGYGAGAIALAGILSLFTWRQMPPLSQATRQWSLLLLVYVGLMLLFLYAGDEPVGAYERLGRYLLAVPLVIALWRWRPSMHCYAISLVLGIAAAFTVVFIVRVIQGKGIGSGYGYQNQIQYSDMVMIMGTAALFASFAYRRFGLSWWLLHAAALLALVGAFLTGGRGGWLVLLPTMALYIAAQEGGKRLKTAIVMLLGVSAFIAFLCSIPQLHISGRVMQIWYDIQQFQSGNAHSSQGARLAMWQCSWHLFAEQPWLGLGSELKQMMIEAADQGLCATAVKDFDHVHNDFIDIFVRYGLLGGTATLLMYAYPAYLYLRALRFPLTAEQRMMAWSGIAVCAAFYTCSMSNAILAHNITSVFFLLFNAYLITGLGKRPIPIGTHV